MPAEPVPLRQEHVVLLHGLRRSKLSLVRLEQNLLNRGYTVSNIDYPSTQHPIEYLVTHYVHPVIAATCDPAATRIHFITHSMGGILARYLLQQHELPRAGRVVMLSPPNQGSEVVDLFRDNPIFKSLYGPAGQQLGTQPDCLPLQLGGVDFELGVIMGNRTVDPLFSQIIPGTNDGKVSVERSQIEGMTDFLLVPHSHTFIIHSPQVIEQSIHFLQHGVFDRTQSESTPRSNPVSQTEAL
jgi:pimeloyl-ACP methyl ester carboxylesterase